MTANNPTTFANSVTIAGNLTVQGVTSLASDNALSLNTATMTTLTVSGVADLQGNTNIGATYADDRVAILGQVTSAILPSANGVDLGNTSKRWDVYGATSNWTGVSSHSGDVRIGSSSSNTRILGASGATTVDSTANVVGDLSIHSDIKNEGGVAFRIYYANGTVAWP